MIIIFQIWKHNIDTVIVLIFVIMTTMEQQWQQKHNHSKSRNTILMGPSSTFCHDFTMIYFQFLLTWSGICNLIKIIIIAIGGNGSWLYTFNLNIRLAWYAYIIIYIYQYITNIPLTTPSWISMCCQLIQLYTKYSSAYSHKTVQWSKHLSLDHPLQVLGGPSPCMITLYHPAGAADVLGSYHP